MRTAHWLGGLCALCASIATPCSAAANDFPTIERVLFVDRCTRDHPDRSRQEMIYKCSCAIDAIAAQVSYEEFVELSTALYAGQIAGERGNQVRDSSEGKDLTGRFRALLAKAYESCLIQ